MIIVVHIQIMSAETIEAKNQHMKETSNQVTKNSFQLSLRYL